MWSETIYDVIHLFDVIAVLASTIVYNRGLQPAAQMQYNKVVFNAGHQY